MIDYRSTAAKKISTIVFGLISAALLARYLGPEGRGQYAVIVSFSAILFSILNFGVSNYYARERRTVGESLARSYCLYFLTLFVIVLSSGALWAAFSDELNLYAVGAMLAAFSLLRMQTQSVLLVEDLRSATRAAIFGAASETSILLLCYLFWDRYVVFAVGALVAKELIILSYSGWRLRAFAGGRRTIWPIGANLLTNRRFLDVIMAFILTALITINYKVDTVIMATLGLPEAQIGIYALGVALAEYLWILSDVFKDVQISRTARGSSASGVVWSSRMAVAITLVAYTGFIAVGWIVVPIVFGNEFLDSYYVTLAMLAATIFMVPCKIIGVYYISSGRLKVYTAIMAVSCALNIVLNFVLVPFFGIYGAVGSSIVSYALAGGWIMRDFSRSESMSIASMLLIRADDVSQIMGILRERIGTSHTKQ